MPRRYAPLLRAMFVAAYERRAIRRQRRYEFLHCRRQRLSCYCDAITPDYDIIAIHAAALHYYDDFRRHC